jgi:superfamily II DNA or RNA helicase
MQSNKMQSNKIHSNSTSIWPQNLNTYLGNKGYTILKKELPITLQITLKELLTVKPYIQGTPFQTQKSFPAYRESDNKIYIPRYFGEDIFGKAKNIKITDGDDIHLEFNGTLRDAQVPVVNTYLQHVNKNVKKSGESDTSESENDKSDTSESESDKSESDKSENDKSGGSGLVELPCGFGKCLGKGTKVLLYNGCIENVENIKVGDLLMGDDSTPRKVLSLAKGKEQMYKIYSNDSNDFESEYFICNESHILSLIYNEQNINISVKDYLTLDSTYTNNLYAYRVPIHFPTLPIHIHPYLIGYNIQINGYIPYEYKCNNQFIRLQVLQGIIDANTCINEYCINEYCINEYCINEYCKNEYCINEYCINEYYKINIKNTNIIDDILYLSRSLGFKTFKSKNSESIIIYKNKSNQNNQNKSNQNNNNNNQLYKIKVEQQSIDDYYGFVIDGNHLFVLGDFTVTHNTSIGLYLISCLKTKTLVIIHKEFLMNQWIERIQEFLPNARIGKIQGQIIDIDNKDIVLVMLQSLSMKDYPASLFDSFGFTIIDEVHHISSEVFSCALFKLVTKYMIGLSATMNRKDGTTKIFKMFLGNIIYKQERSKDDNVIVRGITFKTSDEEFNNIELDFRGQIAASKMLSKICTYNRRSDFIINVLKDMIIENPKQQIMMIASYKNILSYMFDAINYHNICSVGYYVGGMKEASLKNSESKQVVLATYSMASEGLDIKSLSTLIMITPMTNIEQTVGRILRQKHDFQPIVVDIIDCHDNFQRQWNKRKQFYKSQNYKIIQTNSLSYNTDYKTWKTIYEPNTNKNNTNNTNTNININTNINTNKNNTNKFKNIHASSNKSITDDSDTEADADADAEIESNPFSGKCLLTFKK